MKIVKLSGRDTTEGVAQALPLDLGESGRGRTLVHVLPSTAPGKQPAGPPPAGPEVPYASEPPAPGTYFYDPAKAGEYAAQQKAYEAYRTWQARKDAAEKYVWDVDYLPGRPPQGGTVFLLKAGTAPGPKQRGVLIRLNTAGCYTKGSCGSVSPVWGKVEMIAEGKWAEGDAGRVAGGPDVLFHVPGAAFLRAVLQGGSSKGWGARCVVVTAEGKAWMGKTADLAALITSDERPDLAAVVREMLASDAARPAKTAESTDYEAACSCVDVSGGPMPAIVSEASPESRAACLRHSPRPKYPEWYQTLLDAVAAADMLEAAVPDPTTAGIEHYFLGSPPEDWPGLLRGFGLSLPGGQTVPGGVDRVQAGCLMPGQCSMVLISIGPRGGKRYGCSTPEFAGVEVIGRPEFRHGNRGGYYLGIVANPEWSITWTESKDGVQTGSYMAGPEGVVEMGSGDLQRWG